MEAEETVPGPMFLTNEDALLFVDIETFGLDFLNDGVLEVGFALTDRDLDIIEKRSWLVWEPWYHTTWAVDLPTMIANGQTDYKFVVDMHSKSGLIVDAERHGQDIGRVETEIMEWLAEINVPLDKSMPMVGSSVNFDRMFCYFNMRQVYDALHYRVIDISSFKMAANVFAPEMMALMKETVKPQKLHRVMPDLEDSIEEFTFYVDHFLKTER